MRSLLAAGMLVLATADSQGQALNASDRLVNIALFLNRATVARLCHDRSSEWFGRVLRRATDLQRQIYRADLSGLPGDTVEMAIAAAYGMRAAAMSTAQQEVERDRENACANLRRSTVLTTLDQWAREAR